jgi:hypothetical protein
LWKSSYDILNLPVMEQPATLSVAAAFTLILDGLMNAIAARIADYPFTAEMVVFLWKRVNRVKNRFLALAAMIQAGKIPPERGSRPRSGKRSGGRVGPDGINWRKWLPMGTFAWLCWLMRSLPNRFGAAQFGGQLRQLLDRSDMRALLAATPKAGRLLAPLCFMLGIEDSLLWPVCPAPEVLAPVPDIIESVPDAVPLEIVDAPVPFEEARPRVPDPPGDTGANFLNPA